MLTITQKKQAVAELRDKFARAKGIFVADFSGLDVEAVNQLRRNLRAEETAATSTASTRQLDQEGGGRIGRRADRRVLRRTYGAGDLLRRSGGPRQGRGELRQAAPGFRAAGQDGSMGAPSTPAKSKPWRPCRVSIRSGAKLAGLVRAPAQKIAMVLAHRRVSSRASSRRAGLQWRSPGARPRAPVPDVSNGGRAQPGPTAPPPTWSVKSKWPISTQLQTSSRA